MNTDMGEELGLRVVYAQYTRSKKKPKNATDTGEGARRLRVIARSNY